MNTSGTIHAAPTHLVNRHLQPERVACIALVLFAPCVDLLRNHDGPAAVAGYDGTMPFATGKRDQ